MLCEITSLAEALSKIDHRPYHPEDYRSTIIELCKKTSCDMLAKRLQYLLDNPAMYPGGFISVCDFLKTGELRDEYTGELMLVFDDNT